MESIAKGVDAGLLIKSFQLLTRSNAKNAFNSNKRKRQNNSGPKMLGLRRTTFVDHRGLKFSLCHYTWPYIANLAK